MITFLPLTGHLSGRHSLLFGHKQRTRSFQAKKTSKKIIFIMPFGLCTKTKKDDVVEPTKELPEETNPEEKKKCDKKEKKCSKKEGEKKEGEKE